MAILVLLLSLAVEGRIDSSESKLDGPIQSIEFCGPDESVLLVLTTQFTVYRSENQGIKWKSLRSPISGAASTQTTGEIGKVTKILISEADKSLIALIGSNGINWYSEDCGKSVTALNHGRPMEDFQFHPTVREWGLAGSWTKCSDFGNKECKKYKGVFLTKDLGKTWKMLTDYVVMYSWAYKGLATSVQRLVPKERIYVTRLTDATGDQKIKGWSYNVDMVKSDDFFATYNVVVPHGNKFIISNNYILVAQALEETSKEVQLVVANPQDIETFYKVELPVKRLAEHSYTVVDTSEGSIFLHVNHLGPGSVVGNVYVSDASGKRFALSLLRNVRNGKGECDFDKVNGLEGIYLANVQDSNYTPPETTTVQKNRKKNNSKEVAETAYKQTMISFDKGGSWQLLQAPERDSKNKKVTCPDDDCSLHLHSVTVKEFPPFYSADSAVGILLGVGNVGYHLSHKSAELNTYMSRDGGLNWFEIKKGSHIYEIGDHGAILVIADDQNPTDTIHYSWDEGLNWNALKISDEPFSVENIIIESGAVSQSFLVYGERDEKGVVVSLDFTDLHEPQCQNPDRPDTSSSDYELWSPNDGRPGHSCLMGRNTQYLRKKRERECFNGEEFERSTFVENCECTNSDYECDVGYFRTGSKCELLEGSEPPSNQCDQGFTYYEIPTGYRRISGNTCVGGRASALEPLRVTCSGTYIGSTGYMILTVVAIAGGLILLAKYSEIIQKKISELRGIQLFDRSGYTSDFNNAPEGMQEEELHENMEEFDPRS